MRFQLISQAGLNPSNESEGSVPTLEYIESPSDLVPGAYEGGLKTWECSIDLATHLASTTPFGAWTKTHRVLEVRGVFDLLVFYFKRLRSDWMRDCCAHHVPVARSAESSSCIRLLELPRGAAPSTGLQSFRTATSECILETLRIHFQPNLLQGHRT